MTYERSISVAGGADKALKFTQTIFAETGTIMKKQITLFSDQLLKKADRLKAKGC